MNHYCLDCIVYTFVYETLVIFKNVNYDSVSEPSARII